MEEPQEIEDEEYERVYERVAAVDVAKASGVVCTRVPDEDRPGRRCTLLDGEGDDGRGHRAGRSPARPQIEMVTLESTSVIRGYRGAVCHGR